MNEEKVVKAPQFYDEYVSKKDSVLNKIGKTVQELEKANELLSEASLPKNCESSQGLPFFYSTGYETLCWYLRKFKQAKEDAKDRLRKEKDIKEAVQRSIDPTSSPRSNGEDIIGEENASNPFLVQQLQAFLDNVEPHIIDLQEIKEERQ